MKNPIILAGNGHGAHVAFMSLAKYFPEIHLISEDTELIKILRPSDKEISDFLQSNATHCVCAGYQKLIDKSVLDSKVIINTHPSLLPKYRGMHSVVWAMLNGEKEIGFTVHLANEFMDDGDIVAQYKIQNTGQTSKEFMDDFDLYVLRQLGSIVHDYLDGKITPVPQDKRLATWVSKRNLDDCIIDFSMPNWQLRAFFKALVRPYPLPRLIVRNDVYEVTQHELLDVNYYTSVGRVVNIEAQTAYIKTQGGILLVKEIFDTKNLCTVPVNKLLKIGQRL